MADCILAVLPSDVHHDPLIWSKDGEDRLCLGVEGIACDKTKLRPGISCFGTRHVNRHVKVAYYLSVGEREAIFAAPNVSSAGLDDVFGSLDVDFRR